MKACCESREVKAAIGWRGLPVNRRGARAFSSPQMPPAGFAPARQDHESPLYLHQGFGCLLLEDWGSWIGFGDASGDASGGDYHAQRRLPQLEPELWLLNARPLSSTSRAETETHSSESETPESDDDEFGYDKGEKYSGQAAAKDLIALTRSLREFDTEYIPPQEQRLLTRQNLLERHIRDRERIESLRISCKLDPEYFARQMTDIERELKRDRELVNLHQDKLKEMRRMRRSIVRRVEHLTAMGRPANEAASVSLAENINSRGIGTVAKEVGESMLFSRHFQNQKQFVTAGARTRVARKRVCLNACAYARERLRWRHTHRILRLHTLIDVCKHVYLHSACENWREVGR